MDINTASQEYTLGSGNIILTPELIQYYNAALTKPDTAILKELAHSSQTQHKVLATNLHTSTNSLSNRFNRLENIQPALIASERIGRSKYYSLTEIGRAYIERQFPPKNNLIRTFTKAAQDDALLDDTLKILVRFQQVVGNGWDILMDDILSGKVILNEKDEENAEIKTLYEDFLINLKNLHILGKSPYIQDVYNALGQNVLIHRLEKFLDTELTDYRALEPLFKLERQNFEDAFLLIDYAFIQINPTIFKPFGSAQSIQSLRLSKEQINSVVCTILDMVNEFRNYKGDTALAVDHWKEKYMSTGVTLYHIADKCYTIYYSESG